MKNTKIQAFTTALKLILIVFFGFYTIGRQAYLTGIIFFLCVIAFEAVCVELELIVLRSLFEDIKNGKTK